MTMLTYPKKIPGWVTDSSQCICWTYTRLTYDIITQGSGTTLGRYCGNGEDIPRPIASTQRRVSIKFLSDVSVAGNGFRLEWTINGCGGYLRQPKGTFTSPGYPNHYPVRVECLWHIETDLGTSIKLSIAEYDMEGGNDNCPFDHLSIYGGPDSTSPRLTKLCQRKTNVTVTALGNHM